MRELSIDLIYRVWDTYLAEIGGTDDANAVRLPPPTAPPPHTHPHARPHAFTSPHARMHSPHCSRRRGTLTITLPLHRHRSPLTAHLSPFTLTLHPQSGR
eukprot:scaffold58100_cov33-Phaeocystis_antarctica.AAC.1